MRDIEIVLVAAGLTVAGLPHAPEIFFGAVSIAIMRAGDGDNRSLVRVVLEGLHGFVREIVEVSKWRGVRWY